MQITVNTAELTEQEAVGLALLLSQLSPRVDTMLSPVVTRVTPGLLMDSVPSGLMISTASDEDDDAPAASGDKGPPSPFILPARDKDGLPWDSRIHSTPKTIRKDGTWRQKRNSDPALVAQVEAQLRAAMSAGAPPPPPSPAQIAEAHEAAGDNGYAPPPLEVAPPPPPITPQQQALAEAAQAAIAPPPAAPTVPAAPPPGLSPEWQAVMKKITDAQTANLLPTEKVNAALAKCGLTTMRDLIVRPDLIASVDQWITYYIGGGA